jgi:molybdenum cofactor synthesis domain-containing protein
MCAAMSRARVITCSDAASVGEREDRSGPALRDVLTKAGYDVDAVVVVADNIEFIATAIVDAANAGNRLIVTTGGTGIARRDITPEATLRVCDRVIPGFGELMRATSQQTTPMAALSRSQAATLGTALILNLPGSERGAIENLNAVIHLIPHALELLEGNTEHGKK